MTPPKHEHLGLMDSSELLLVASTEQQSQEKERKRIHDTSKQNEGDEQEQEMLNGVPRQTMEPEQEDAQEMLETLQQRTGSSIQSRAYDTVDLSEPTEKDALLPTLTILTETNLNGHSERRESSRPPPSAAPTILPTTAVTPTHLENFFSLEEMEDGENGSPNDDDEWDVEIEDDDKDKKKKDIDEDESEEDEPTCISKFRLLPAWARFLILEFSGSILLMVPAATLMIIDPGYMPDLNTFDYRQLTQIENQLESLHQLVRFSMWLSVAWFALIFWWFFLRALPGLLVQATKWLYGQCSVTFQSRLDYIHFVHPFLAFATWMITNVILYTIIFAQWQIVQSWFTGFRILCVILIFSICLVCQRLLVQMIAVRFHKLVYEERIKDSKKAIKILDRLRKSIKTVGLTDIFDLAGEIQKTVIDPLSAGIKKVGADATSLGDGKSSVNAKKKKTVVLMDHPKHDGKQSPDSKNAIPLQTFESTKSQEKFDQVAVLIPTASSGVDIELEDPARASSTTWSQWYRRPSKPSEPATALPAASSDKNSPISFSDKSTDPSLSPKDERLKKCAAKKSNRFEALKSGSGGTLKRRKMPTRSNTEVSDSRITAPNAGAVKIGGSSYRNKVHSTQVLDESHALALAKKLFYALLKFSSDEKGKELTIEAFRPFFPTSKSCDQAFRLFDKDGNGTITKKEMKSSILYIYRERRNLFKSLRDLSEALGRLNLILYGFSGFLTAFLSLPVYGIELTAVLPFTSILVALSFVFGSATRNTFECIIFLFVTHPYDTGDRIIIDGSTYLVDEVNLLTTVLVRSDGQRIYAPNATLTSKLIHNIRRSGDQSEQITFELDFSTPESTVRQLQEKMVSFLQASNRDYGQNCSINLSEMDGHTGRIKCTTTLTYKGNWQDGGKRWMRRTNYMWALKKAMEELGLHPHTVHPTEIVFKEPVPTYSVDHRKGSGSFI